MSSEVTGLIWEGNRAAGVSVKTPDGMRKVHADLIVGADGRHSTVRREAGFVPNELGAPMDVLWFHLPRSDEDREETFGRFDAGQILVLLNRGSYWQCGYVIAKGSASHLRAQGIETLRQRIATLAPFLANRVDELKSFDDASLLTVAVDRLPRWHRPGLLCIGDCAHVMSPVGGVGINLAIQDAIAAANILAAPLAGKEALSEELLAQVQKRREWPAKVIQAIQVAIQKNVISRVLRGTGKPVPPFLVRLFIYLPVLRRLPAGLIGLGVQREHIDSPSMAR
jgi:2-polyprenyl-6-methoxyphenol hydroxylase-like FAD-dependent oxidoreductase